MAGPFKDRLGRYLTEALFVELSGSGTKSAYDPVYSLADPPADGYISAKQIYLESNDPTEYTAAMALVGSWQHWERLCANTNINKYIFVWRKELEVKLRSQAIKSIMYQAADSTPAAKYIAQKGWESKRGRPTKEEIEGERKIQAGIDSEVAADAKRLGLN